MSRGARLGLIAAAVAVAVIAFIALRPADDEDDDKAATTTEQREPGTSAQGSPEPEEPPAPPVERIQVRGGEPVGGVREITVESGDEVRLAVSADAPEHVHVHGYDLFKDVAPGQSARFKFEADIEGIFEIELEDSRTLIAELRVEP